MLLVFYFLLSDSPFAAACELVKLVNEAGFQVEGLGVNVFCSFVGARGKLEARSESRCKWQ